MKEFVSERWSKSRLDRLVRKVDAGLPDYQLTILLVEVVCATFFESSQPVRDVHVRIHVAPPSVLPIH